MEGGPRGAAVTFFEIPRDLLPEQLDDGRFRCKTCGATWWPFLDGRLEPTLASLRCPRCPAVHQAPHEPDTAPALHARDRE